MYNYKEEIEPTTRPCDAPGCKGKGEHRAPKDRGEKPDYYWFCMEHVREYNRSWDYFAGMNSDEIQKFQEDAAFGHRPTWNHQTRTKLSEKALHAKWQQFMHGSPPPVEEYLPPIAQKHKQALHTLELEHPSDRKTIKDRYKTLVKQYHPDINQGDKEAEERFKRINVSYRLLMEEYIV